MLKMVFKADYFANLSWIALCDWIKIYEWLLGVEHDVYHEVMYILLYLYCEKLIMVDAYMLIDRDVASEYIYVNWIVNVVGDCIYVKWWWIVGECIYAKWLVMMWWIVVWTYALSWVICSCIHDWWWQMFISKM